MMTYIYFSNFKKKCSFKSSYITYLRTFYFYFDNIIVTRTTPTRVKLLGAL